MHRPRLRHVNQVDNKPPWPAAIATISFYLFFPENLSTKDGMNMFRKWERATTTIYVILYLMRQGTIQHSQTLDYQTHLDIGEVPVANSAPGACMQQFQTSRECSSSSQTNPPAEQIKNIHVETKNTNKSWTWCKKSVASKQIHPVVWSTRTYIASEVQFLCLGKMLQTLQTAIANVSEKFSSQLFTPFYVLTTIIDKESFIFEENIQTWHHVAWILQCEPAFINFFIPTTGL